jgi:peptidoglycan/xylan/chitin deacetylase (PgdA/CDA1 family)
MKRLLLILAIALAALYGTYRYSKSRTHQLFGTIVDRVETEKKVVALTFDDGPTAYAVDEILSALGPTRATFFLTGFGMHDSPAVAARLVAAGNEIGNHTFHHDRMVLKSPHYIAEEIESVDRLIRAAGWKGPILFRAPFCKKLVGLPWYLSRHDRIDVTWDIDPESDPEIDHHTDRIVDFVLTRAHPGSIILLHPWYHGREPTRDAIAPIIAGLRARGYDFVTVSELLSIGRGVSGSRGHAAGDHPETARLRDPATTP